MSLILGNRDLEQLIERLAPFYPSSASLDIAETGRELTQRLTERPIAPLTASEAAAAFGPQADQLIRTIILGWSAVVLIALEECAGQERRIGLDRLLLPTGAVEEWQRYNDPRDPDPSEPSETAWTQMLYQGILVSPERLASLQAAAAERVRSRVMESGEACVLIDAIRLTIGRQGETWFASCRF